MRPEKAAALDEPVRQAVYCLSPSTRVLSVDCLKRPGPWSTPHYIEHEEFGLTLIRRGGFLRRFRGADAFVDPAMAYVQPPGSEQHIRHTLEGGDACTILVLSSEEFASIAADDALPSTFLPVQPRVDLGHRALLARLRRGVDRFEFHERLVRLIGDLVEASWPGRISSSRPATIAAHRRIVDHAREAIAADPADVRFDEVAQELGHSRYHVSRVFSEVTGTTLSRHRNRIRTAAALDRLQGGESNLASLAADLGFVDQSHMVRVVRAATGRPPSGIRRWFRDGCIGLGP